MQYLNTNNHNYSYRLPSILIIELDGFRGTLTELEEELDQNVNTEDIFNQLLISLKRESDALLELDYCCLSLVHDYCLGEAVYDELNLMINYVRRLGLQLYQNFRMHQAYVNGMLPYRYCDMRSNGLYLKREDLFHDEIKREFRDQQSAVGSQLHRFRFQ